MSVKTPVVKKTPEEAVSSWLRDSVHGSKYEAPLVPRNTPSDTPTGYIHQTDASRAFARQPIAEARQTGKLFHDVKPVLACQTNQ